MDLPKIHKEKLSMRPIVSATGINKFAIKIEKSVLKEENAFFLRLSLIKRCR